MKKLRKRIPLAELALHEINTDFLKLLDNEKRHIFEFKIYSDFYEKLKKFRNNYTKCINCKEYFIGSKPKGFCDKQECQESKSSYGGSERTSIEKLIKYPINKDLLRLLDSENRYFYEFKNYPEFLSKLEEFRNTVTKCKVCGNYFDEPSKKCGTGYCNKPKCQTLRKSKESEAFGKRSNTNLKKFGVKNASENKEIANKIGKSNKLKKDTALIKRKETNLKKFGSENPMSLDSTKEKMKQTNLEKYGSEYFFSSETGINKIKETFIEKYGSIENKNKIVREKVKEAWNYVDKEEANKKREVTNIKKYGSIENYKNNISKKIRLKWKTLDKAAIREKAKNTIITKYGSLENRNKIAIENMIKTNKEKYGVDFFTQKNISNLNYLNREKFLEFVENDLFDIEKCCEYFNASRYTINYYKKVFEINNTNKSPQQKTQRFIFSKIKTENKLINDRKVISPHELDIFLPECNLAIEYDGLMYHSFGKSKYSIFNNTKEEPNYHLRKTELCESNGIQLFHIFEGESIDLWLSMIHNKLGLNTRIPARKCYIREITNKETNAFLNENHIQGFINSKINLGLYINLKDFVKFSNLPEGLNSEDNEILVAVMTFSSPRFNKNYEYELIRFCNLKNTNVVGGASKLFKYFARNYNPKSIISYANRRFSDGNLYKKLGFKLKNITKPNYFYFKNNSFELESRNKYQKHKLKDILKDFNPELTETENMFLNGYRKIYDCGNFVFEYRK